MIPSRYKGIDKTQKKINKDEYDKIIDLMNRVALDGFDTGRLDGRCEKVIPLEDAIAIIDCFYKAEREDKK